MKLNHIISTAQFLDTAVLQEIFDLAAQMEKEGSGNSLAGKLLATVFYEPSTRTRLSFEAAMQRLGGGIISTENAATFSSAIKGESLEDAIKVIAGYADAIVLRHPEKGSAKRAAEVSPVPLINAGDGAGEHPTQALLDMYSIREKIGRIDGLKICIVGDIAHSRVALSNIFGLKTMGAKVSVCGPSTMIPRQIEELGVDVINNIDEAIQENDILNVLRIQLERKAGESLPSLREYAKYFGITKERLEKNGKNILILHPGPINRGVEISSEVADGSDQIILNQVTNGVAVRMAVLYLLGTLN
ncbi:MAG: aspartate carbamoyltransferase catalytic subunit [Bacteroidetes bacterium]|nr:aspartate carbamoyltransferase catalytic subunit [Bacteroidota bacterium]